LTRRGPRFKSSKPSGELFYAPPDFTVEATDASGVAQVELLLDGELGGRLDAPPFRFDLGERGLDDGEPRAVARARDPLGNESESVERVFVLEPPPLPEPGPDAGAPGPNAGAPDAGPHDAPAPVHAALGGCGCGSGAGAALPFVAVAALGLLRRRRSA
jgi:uncharacterized protein (TIGR03382 family)